ncbi:hypothetical protein HWI79_519 [Cryptosporidium felis]|nr:hypothetical protein HWI79_519 [Cryptosporidium felis]
MNRNSRDEIFDRRMKTNNYDNSTIGEIRGRIRRINGHRTSSLSDIKNFQSNIDHSTLRLNDNSSILISENTLLELKQKVDESETQKHFMNALKERLKETTHEKDALVKKSQADKETIRMKNEEISKLKDEISRLNDNISELKEILVNSKQRILELEAYNDGNNLMTGTDMQSRTEPLSDSPFRSKGEIKTLQDELFNETFSSNSSNLSSKDTSKSNIRHVLFNDVTENFVDNSKVGSIQSNQNSNSNIKMEWMKLMMKLNGFIFFKSKMILMRQFLIDEESQLLTDLSLENNKRSSNVGYSGPNENKIKMLFSPLKSEINEILHRLDRDGDDEEHIFTEKKHLLSILDDQIGVLKDRIETVGSNSVKSSINSSRIMSFSDITTEKSSNFEEIPQDLNSSRSSKFSEKIRSGVESSFATNRKLLFIFVRLKLWLIEEILYDEQVIYGNTSIAGSNEDSKSLANYFENAYEFIINIEENENYAITDNSHLTTGLIQMLYVLSRQWERSITNETRLLSQLQEMVRIYHRLKSFLLTSSKIGTQNDFAESLYTDGNLQEQDFESLHLSNENNYVLQIERELTSLGLGILSGRDLNAKMTNGGSSCNNSNSSTRRKIDRNGNEDDIDDPANKIEGLLNREQVNGILRHLEGFPDPFVANKNEILAIRELIRPLKSYGRRAPEPYIGFFALMAQRLDKDIIQHDREIRAFQKVIKGLEDQCDRQQEELEELHEELEQLYNIIENKHEAKGPDEGDESEKDDEKGEDNKTEHISNNEDSSYLENKSSKEQVLEEPGSKPKDQKSSQISDKEWINMCKQTSLGLSDE